MSRVSVDRHDWPEVVRRFRSFFAGRGEITETVDAVTFEGRAEGNALVLRQDGTSSSFMPLHGLEARWDQITFDATAEEVVLEAEGVSYTYRMPPGLRRTC